MNNFFQQIEATLLPTADQYLPEGTDPKAVAHHWIHALAYGFAPVCCRAVSWKKQAHRHFEKRITEKVVS